MVIEEGNLLPLKSVTRGTFSTKEAPIITTKDNDMAKIPKVIFIGIDKSIRSQSQAKRGAIIKIAKALMD